MRVALLYFADCPNWREAGYRLRQALLEIGRPDIEIDYQAVETDVEAAAAGFAGSPTFHVDGSDLFDTPAAGTLACRIYATGDGLSGVPDVAALTTALRKHVGS